MVEIITGAIIAIASAGIGYYIRGKQPTVTLSTTTTAGESDIDKQFKTNKGLYSYKKYVSS